MPFLLIAGVLIVGGLVWASNASAKKPSVGVVGPENPPLMIGYSYLVIASAPNASDSAEAKRIVSQQLQAQGFDCAKIIYIDMGYMPGARVQGPACSCYGVFSDRSTQTSLISTPNLRVHMWQRVTGW